MVKCVVVGFFISYGYLYNVSGVKYGNEDIEECEGSSPRFPEDCNQIKSMQPLNIAIAVSC